MDLSRVNALAGKQLKAWREKLGLSTRAVRDMSRQIAREKQNEEFFLSHNWVTDIENGRFRPGMFRMYAISVIYRRNYTEVAALYGLQMGDLRRDMASIDLPKTHLVESLGEPESEAVSLPCRIQARFPIRANEPVGARRRKVGGRALGPLAASRPAHVDVRLCWPGGLHALSDHSARFSGADRFVAEKDQPRAVENRFR